MVIIDFSDTQKEAFARGFNKGISAPLMLFALLQAPEIKAIPEVVAPSTNDSVALASDWKAIGIDLGNVI